MYLIYFVVNRPGELSGLNISSMTSLFMSYFFFFFFFFFFVVVFFFNIAICKEEIN